MKSKKYILLISIVVLAMAFTCSPPLHKRIKNEKQLADTTLQKIYNGTVSKMYEYMFSQRENVILINKKRYGVFKAGLKGLVLYSNFTESIASVLNLGRPRFYSIEPIAALAKMPVFSSGENKFISYRDSSAEYPFHFYNPEIVKWAYQNLIPDPNMEIGGQTAQVLYDKIYFKFFRTMTESYLFLNETNNFELEKERYELRMKEKDFRAFEYLEDMYGEIEILGLFDQYSEPTRNYAYGVGGLLSNAEMSPNLACGFWLRRGIDGSKNEIWQGLSRLMLIYDKEWFLKKLEGWKRIDEENDE